MAKQGKLMKALGYSTWIQRLADADDDAVRVAEAVLRNAYPPDPFDAQLRRLDDLPAPLELASTAPLVAAEDIVGSSRMVDLPFWGL
eukprot:NODE_20819_length_781_cov_2.015291.p4 GENE.NODE_20819_length_781_cov_2.015291~~NODE_20819_length_781_cov_2.015291.p4  ORF type:complete len:98 (+),score=29.37 NODE_20819_length_781_cov_2.015291:36-296(+)